MAFRIFASPISKNTPSIYYPNPCFRNICTLASEISWQLSQQLPMILDMSPTWSHGRVLMKPNCIVFSSSSSSISPNNSNQKHEANILFSGNTPEKTTNKKSTKSTNKSWQVFLKSDHIILNLQSISISPNSPKNRDVLGCNSFSGDMTKNPMMDWRHRLS